MLNDLSLVHKIKEGDIHAFEQLFRAYYQPLLLYGVNIVKREEIVEEIIQDIFYVLWRDRSKIRIFQSIKAYLYKSVYNESLQHLKKTSVRERYHQTVQSRTVQPTVETPEEALEAKELKELIESSLNQATKRQQEIYLSHREEGMTYAEIAQKHSVSIKTVEAEISKVLRLLRKSIEQYCQSK